MTSRIMATIPWKLKDAIHWLVTQDFYSSESEFIIIAVNEKLAQEVMARKFVWAEVTPVVEDLSTDTSIKNSKKG